MADKFRASMVKVVRVYEVRCEHPACNCNVDSEFHHDRDEAVRARDAHIAEHRRDDAMPPSPVSAFDDDRRFREF